MDRRWRWGPEGLKTRAQIPENLDVLTPKARVEVEALLAIRVRLVRFVGETPPGVELGWRAEKRGASVWAEIEWRPKEREPLVCGRRFVVAETSAWDPPFGDVDAWLLEVREELRDGEAIVRGLFSSLFPLR